MDAYRTGQDASLAVPRADWLAGLARDRLFEPARVTVWLAWDQR